MTQVTEDKTETASDPARPRRRWMPLAIALAVGAAVLGWEYRDTVWPLLSGGGLSALLLVVCVAMHFLMHRGHGGHGGDKSS